MNELGLLRRGGSIAIGLAFYWFFSLGPTEPAGARGGSAPTNEEEAPESRHDPEIRAAHYDEIVVTARRRDEKLVDVPVSVTVFDSVRMEELSMDDLSDVADFTPNLDFSLTGGLSDESSQAVVVLRGVGQLDTALFSDPGVGIYLDGVFLARAQGAVTDLVDLERVEVLRGPQGTYFGKNTTGGVLQLVTRPPSSELAAHAAATLGSFHRRDFLASVAGEAAAGLNGSVSLLSADRRGFARSLETGQRFGDQDHAAGRAALRWQPAPATTFDLSADFTREGESGSHQILLALEDTPILDFYNRSLVAGGRTPFDRRWVAADFRRTHATGASFLDGDVYGVTLRAQRLFTGFDFRSISAYRGFEYHSAGDFDASPLTASERSLSQRQDQLSQELHVAGRAAQDRLEWLVGGLYFRERPRQQNSDRVLADLFDALEAAPGPVVSPPGVPAELCAPGAPDLGIPCFGGAGNPLNLAFFNGFGGRQSLDLETTSTALFGEATYQLGPRFSAAVGARYTRDEKSFSYQNENNLGVIDSDLFNAGSWSAWTPRLSLTYRVRPEWILYASASRGFKSGGFNGRPQQRQALDPYDPETVLAYEAGFKATALGRRLSVAGAVFRSDYEDIQFAAALDVGGQPVFVLQNAGTARIVGGEVELSAQGERLSASAGLGYLDSELTSLDPRLPTGLSEGAALPKAPRWTASVSLRRTFPIEAAGTLVANLDYSFRGAAFNDVANSPSIVQEGYGLVNARVAFLSDRGPWEIALFGTNLADEDYLERGFFAGGFGVSLGIPGRPREWGLTLAWRHR